MARYSLRSIGAVCFALALALAGCHAADRKAEAPADPAPAVPGTVSLTPEAIAQGGVKTAPVGLERVAEAIALPGTLQPQSDALVVINARTAGQVEVLVAQVGDRVRAGQTLAAMTSLELAQVQAEHHAAALTVRQDEAALQRQRALSRIAREQASAKVEAARRQFSRAEKLFADGIVSRQDYELAQSTLRQAELGFNEAGVLQRDAEAGTLSAELARARQTVASSAEHIKLLGGSVSGVDGRIPVVSPIAGQVASREVTRGQAVDPSAPLFKIVDAGKLVAVLDVPEGQAQRLRVGAPVSLSLDALPNRRFAAKVAAVGSVVDPGTRKLSVRCDVANPGGVLKPGMYVTASVPTRGEEWPVVPESALQTMDEKPVVFVATGDGRFERREVTPGARSGGRVAIVKGLEAGERVVIAGAFWLKSELQKSELEE